MFSIWGYELKVMMIRKVRCQIFQVPFLLWGEENLITTRRKGIGNLTLDSCFHHNFLFIISKQNCKIILDIYVSRSFQLYKQNLIWTQFTPIYFCQTFMNLFPKGNCSSRDIAPWGNLVSFSLREKVIYSPFPHEEKWNLKVRFPTFFYHKFLFIDSNWKCKPF